MNDDIDKFKEFVEQEITQSCEHNFEDGLYHDTCVKCGYIIENNDWQIREH